MKKFKFVTEHVNVEAKIDFNSAFEQFRPQLNEIGKNEIISSSLIKELVFGMDCINRINNKETKNSQLTDYNFPDATTVKFNSIVNDKDFLKKLIHVSEIVNLASTAFKLLNADMNLFIKKGTGVGNDYIVARAAIQSFEYIKGERKATTKRFSAHVGLLSNYPKGLKDKKAIADALPKLYNKILKRDPFNF
jgi:hypothetical protein